MKVIVLAVALALTPLSAAQAKPSWKTVYSTPNLKGDEAFEKVVVTSRTQGWAFGQRRGTGHDEVPLALHWNGRKWRNTPLPKGLHAMQDLVATSPKNAWLLEQPSELPSGKSRLLRWNGRAWKVARTFKHDGPSDIIALKSGEVWLFPGGDSRDLLRFDKKRWHRVRLARPISSTMSPDQKTIFALAGGDRPVARYDGKRWADLPSIQSVQPSGPDRQVYLQGLDVVGPREVYLQTEGVRLGPVDENGGRPETSEGVKFLRWDGKSWRVVKGDRHELAWATPDGHGGFYALRSVGERPEHLYHRTAKGKWKALVKTPVGQTVSSIAVVPGTTRLFAAGSFDGRWDDSGTILTYKG